jgi:ankyrin repeat protein
VAGSAGHAAIVRRLIELTPVIDAKDNDGRTPLANAALAGEVEIVELLLRHGARANETTGDDRSILMALACEDKPPRVREVVRILLKNGADPNVAARDAWIPTPLLLKAASKRSLGMVKSLLEHKGTNQVEPNVTGKRGWNALHFVADADPGSDGGEVTTEIAGLLIVAGINPLERDYEGWIPLHMAARSGNLPLLQFLWDKHPESVATTDDDGRTVVDFGRSYPHVTQWILSKMKLAYIDQANSKGETILMGLASVGNVESTRTVLKMNADPTLQDSQGRTELHRAAYNGHIEAAKALLEWKLEILSYKDAANRTALHQAILSYKSEFACMLLDKYYAHAEYAREDLSAVETEGGRTPLISAVVRRYSKVIEKLLELGAKTETRDKNGDTALLLAVRRGNGSIVQLLISPGAPNGNRVDIDAGGGIYPTALHEAAVLGNRYLVNRLLLAGANVNQEGGVFNTALCAACCIEDDGTVGLLLENGADITLSGGQFPNALSCAVYSESMSLVDTLMAAGVGIAEINAQDKQGRTAVHIAARWCGWEMIEVLRNKGADLSKEDKQRRTLLHHAVLGGDLALVMTILGEEKLLPLLHATDVDGWTPLHWACRVPDNYAVVEALIDHGADSCAPTRQGWTPESIAIFHNEPLIAGLLEERTKARDVDTDSTPSEHATDGKADSKPTTRRQWRVASNESTTNCDSCHLYVSFIYPPTVHKWTFCLQHAGEG